MYCCPLWCYLCTAWGSAAPARDCSPEDGRPPRTVPGPRPRFLSWREEAPCSTLGWATPPNCESHCCLSESGKRRRENEDMKRLKQRQRQKLDIQVHRCSPEREEILTEAFSPPCHNGNLHNMFPISKSSLFMSLPLSIYTRLITCGCGKGVTAGFKASDCCPLLSDVNWIKAMKKTRWSRREIRVNWKMEVLKTCPHTLTHTLIPAC